MSTWLMLGCSEETACERDTRKVESCGRMFKADVCQTADDRCYTHCFGRASCAELTQVDNDETPVWLSRCFAKCTERLSCDDGQTVSDLWRCDGAKDCVDGADEQDCEYHECADGQLVREEARCNEYSECQDGSDEEGCL